MNLKILEYATAFFLFVFFAMTASRWIQKIDFFPVWLIACFFILSVVSLYFFLKFKNVSAAETPKSVMINSENPPPENAPADYNEIWQQEKEAHEFVVKLCEAKNIKLTLKQEGKSGHCEIPEIWTLEKAVPLTPEDLYAITANKTLRAVTKPHDDGIIYAESFSRNGSWTIYEQEK